MAFLAKLGWQIITKQDRLWVKVLEAKYGDLLGEPRNLNASSTWRNLRRIVDLLKAGLESSNHLHAGNSTATGMYTWKANASGVFTVSSAYELQLPPCPSLEQKKWRRIWMLKGQLRANFMLWQTMHGVLPTKECLAIRHIGDSSLCDICGTEVETHMHALRYCRWIQKCWKTVVCPSHWARFFGANRVQDWIIQNLTSELGQQRFYGNWKYLFRQMVNGAWYWRNQYSHQTSPSLPDPNTFIYESLRRVMELNEIVVGSRNTRAEMPMSSL